MPPKAQPLAASATVVLRSTHPKLLLAPLLPVIQLKSPHATSGEPNKPDEILGLSPTRKHIAVKDAYKKMLQSLNDPNIRMKETPVSARSIHEELFGGNRVKLTEQEAIPSLNTTMRYAKHLFKQKVGITGDISLEDFKEILIQVLAMLGIPAVNITLLVNAIMNGIRVHHCIESSIERVDFRQLAISITSMHEDIGSFPQLMHA